MTICKLNPASERRGSFCEQQLVRQAKIMDETQSTPASVGRLRAADLVAVNEEGAPDLTLQSAAAFVGGCGQRRILQPFK
jgi:hypothetical protein